MARHRWAHGPVESPMNHKARSFLEELTKMRDWRREQIDEGEEDGRKVLWARHELGALGWAINQLSALEDAWLDESADEQLTDRIEQLDKYVARAHVMRKRLVDVMQAQAIGNDGDEGGDDE